MQFLVYGIDPTPESAPPPTPELLADLGKLTEDMTKAGVLVTTGALPPKGVRLRLSGGKFTVTDGPFIEVKELMGGFAVIRAKSLEEAIELSKPFRQIVGDGESEIIPIFGPE